MHPRVPVKGLPGTQYGYGLIFKQYRGEPVAYHTGARLGYGSIIDLAPSKKVAVVALGNRTGALLTDCIRTGFASQFQLEEPEDNIPTGGDYVTDREMMSPFVGRFLNFPPIEVEVYDRSALPLIRVGGILTIKKGYERIPLRIINDTTASNGYQRIGLTRGMDGRVQLLHIEMHTLKRVEK
jgi:CubicO group peptidase (beta-lactamase class C family)